jgi:hypothetical protein
LYTLYAFVHLQAGQAGLRGTQHAQYHLHVCVCPVQLPHRTLTYAIPSMYHGLLCGLC